MPIMLETAMRLVQLLDAAKHRRVGIVEGDELALLAGHVTVRELALAAITKGHDLATEAGNHAKAERVTYATALAEGRVLPPLDHPDPAHCLVTGTGLTHLGSAATRDSMHKKLATAGDAETDSIRMFKLGLAGGKPAGTDPGVQPEWFYKGDGSTLVAPGAALPLPSFALDGGEEPEIAGLYVIAPNGTPHRVGYALGNEYSDHVTERQNYLYLAHSKLRASAIGPELRLGALPAHVEGESRIVRDGAVIWRKPFVSGEANMSHTLANLEFHHFKYALFRRPGDVHVHYFGTATLSFADGIVPQPGDVFEMEVETFGKPLRNGLAPAAAGFSYGGVATL
jgi:hypothetical protein